MGERELLSRESGRFCKNLKSKVWRSDDVVLLGGFCAACVEFVGFQNARNVFECVAPSSIRASALSEMDGASSVLARCYWLLLAVVGEEILVGDAVMAREQTVCCRARPTAGLRKREKLYLCFSSAVTIIQNPLVRQRLRTTNPNSGLRIL